MKQKTHKGAKKRIKISKSGKMSKGTVVNSHNKRKQGSSKKFRKARESELSMGFGKKLKKMINI